VLELDSLELGALETCHRPIEVSSDDTSDRFRQSFRDDHRAPVDIERCVVVLRVKRDSQIRRDRPGRGRPNQYGQGTPIERRDARTYVLGAVRV
jgi:hypothetical protein